MGTPFPLLVFKNTLRHCEPFPEQNTLEYRISHIQCQMFSRGDTLGTRRSAWCLARCLDYRRISTWLASVSIVPVLQIDHCSAHGVSWLVFIGFHVRSRSRDLHTVMKNHRKRSRNATGLMLRRPSFIMEDRYRSAFSQNHQAELRKTGRN